MGIRRKVFYPVAFSAMLFASSAMAKINPTAFVGVSEYFLKDKAKNIDMGFYDPTLGEVALESGLIENIRFFGAYEAGVDRNGERVYIEDTSTDPLWNVAKILFPSNNGQLGTTTDAVTNFAKYVKNPKTVALLLNYAKKVEDVKGKANLPAKVTQQFTVEILKTLEGMGAGKATIDNFKKKTLNPLLTAIRESIESEKKGTSLYPRHTTEQVIEAFFCYQFNTQEDIWPLLESLDSSIVDKNKPLPTQTHYLDENDLKVIAAKPDLNFDDLFDLTQANIFTSLTPYRPGINLLNNGETHFYDRAHNSYVRGKTFQDCVETAGRHLSHLLTFNSVTRGFDLKPIEDFVAKKESESGVKNPYFDNYKNFYSEQTLLTANAGDLGTRSLWNTVVGDLPNTIYRREENNEIKSGFINLLNTFDTLFSLSLAPAPTTGLAAKKTWVEESLITLFSAFNPDNTYTVDLQGAESANEVIGDALITVKNTVENENLFSFNLQVKMSHTEVNQLKLAQAEQAADTLKNHLNILTQGTADESILLLASPALQQNIHPFYKLYSQALADNAAKINFLKELGDNYEFWKTLPSFQPNLPLIQSMTKNVMNSIGWEDEYVKSRISPILFSLAKSADFQTPLERVKELKIYKASFDEITQRMQNLKNLEVLNLGGNGDIQGNLSLTTELEKIKKLTLSVTPITGITGLENVPNLEELILRLNSKLTGIDFSTPHGTLKKLDLMASGIKTLQNLHNLSSLEELLANETHSLSELSFTGTLGKLKSLQLIGSGLTRLEGVENLPNLENFQLSLTPNLSKVEFAGSLEKLKNIDLGSSGITKLTGLNNVPNLERLDLEETKNLSKIEFEVPLNNLKNLLLKKSGITELEGLKNLINLKELELEETNNLSKLEFTEPLEKLEKINLFRSGLSQLTGLENVPNVKELNLRNTRNLSEVAFEGRLEGLTHVTLVSSGIQKLTGLDNLENLKELDLTSAANIRSLKFEKDNKDLHLNLRGSGIRSRDDIEGFEHLDPSKVRF